MELHKLGLLGHIRELYARGGNIIEYLKGSGAPEHNTPEDILISYDFQAGSYIRDYRADPRLQEQYSTLVARELDALGRCSSIIEAGCGDATTLGTLVQHLALKPRFILGFDISWSRIKFARAFLKDIGVSGVDLFVGDLFSMPLPDNSVDIVLTSHAIEPNTGKEKEALAELYRVARRYVVLLEPSYEFAGDMARTRMKEHGYITELLASAQALGYTIIKHELLDMVWNPLNPTALMIIKKEGEGGVASPATKPQLVCPVTKTALVPVDGALYSPESFLAYPVIGGTPCLIPSQAVLATHLLERVSDDIQKRDTDRS